MCTISYITVSAQPGANAISYKVLNAPVIDGVANETVWDNAIKYDCSHPFTGEEDGFTGPEDFAGYWKTVWNDSGVFVLIQVTIDDVHYSLWSNGADWQTDVSEVYIDMNIYNLLDGLGPSSEGSGHYYFTGRTTSDSTIHWGSKSFKFTHVNSDATYTQEMFLAWDDLHDENGNILFDPLEVTIGFDVMFTDNDGVENNRGIDPRSRMVWANDGTGFSGSEDWIVMDDAGLLTFKDDIIYDPYLYFDSIPKLKYGVSPYKLHAYTNYGLTVSYKSANDSIALITNDILTIKKGGSCYIYASVLVNGDTLVAKRYLVVDKVPLLTIVNSINRMAGKPDPDFSITYEGFKNGDDESSFDKAPDIISSATIGSPVGKYDLIASNGESDNYYFIYVPGILTIFPEVGISDVNSNKIGIYPNPASNLLTISGLKPGKATVEIYNMQGKLVYSNFNVTKYIDISNLYPSIYLVKVNEKERIVISQVILKK